MSLHNTNARTNIVLVGMPGAGKSTLGKLLARRLNADFVDTDTLLAEALKMPLRQWLEEKGQASFRTMEDTLVSNLHVQGAVIATGGSVVYGQAAMQHLARIGWIIYVEVSPAELQRRIAAEPRPIVWPGNQTFEQLYAERDVLYRRHAVFTIRGDGTTPEKAIEWLTAQVDRLDRGQNLH